MKRRAHSQVARSVSSVSTSEMLLLPDGRILVHNLTPKLARWLRLLNPDDPQIAPRPRQNTEHATRNTHPQ